MEPGSVGPAGSEAAAEDYGSGWSQAVEVNLEFDPCVTYRARIQGEYLVVEAQHGAGWHTYSLDNEVRAAEKLAGAESLGIELPTSFTVEGADVAGPWLQNEPEDLSDPEIQWFTWGFSGTTTFAAKIQNVGPAPLVIAIRGQVCNAETCRDIDIEVLLDPTTNRSSRALELDDLVPIRSRDPNQPRDRPGTT
jgi:hypothetical protein